MKREKSLMVKLKVCDVEIQLYVRALEKENLCLQRKVANLQAKNVSYQNEIATLKKGQPNANFSINIGAETKK